MRHSPKHFDEITSLFSASCPFGKLSVQQNVRSAKRPSAKCPFGKMSFGKMSFGKVSFGNNQILCNNNVDGDQPLDGEILTQWTGILNNLSS
jgi:hypothetical protein